MTMTQQKTRGLVLGLVLLTGACQDLDTENLQAPDRNRALNSPTNVESLIRGGYAAYYSTTESGSYPAWSFSVGADEMSSSWGNEGMQQFSSEPRVAYPNDLVFSYRALTESPWTSMYRIISNMNEGLAAIADGMQFGTNGADTRRAEAMARFAQGLAHVWIALQYDKGFIYLETDDPNTTEFQVKPYTEIFAVGMQQLDQAKAIAQQNTFSMDVSWIFGQTTSNTQLVRVINSYQARFLAAVARTPEERAAVNWQRVIDLANAGITADWGPIIGGTGTWTVGFKRQMGMPDWFRGDYKLLGPADVSGAYKAWLDTPVGARQPFDINTPDRRIQGTGGVTTKGKHWTYRLPQNFNADRGTYHFSRYYQQRWATLQPPAASPGTGLNPFLSVAELDLLKAEGYIRLNQAALAVPLINKSRVAVGELTPVTVDGVPQAEDCVPRWDGVTCGTLWQALLYEKRIEGAGVSGGVAYFDARGWGILVPGTQVHFPIPARELDLLGLSFYTFGGVGNPGAAR
jgi:hypothetical protein